MLCVHHNHVYSDYKYFYQDYSAGIDFSRQNLTSTDVILWRLKSIPALYGLKIWWNKFYGSGFIYIYILEIYGIYLYILEFISNLCLPCFEKIVNK